MSVQVNKCRGDDDTGAKLLDYCKCSAVDLAERQLA